MLDRDTWVRDPHDATVTRKGGHTERRVIDPRVSEMQNGSADGVALPIKRPA